MTRNFSKSLLVGGAVCAIAMAAQPAIAQDNGADGEEQQDTGGIGTIIVTAQKRADSVQDSSISINAITGDQLLDQGIASVKDLEKLTTGVNFVDGATPIFYVRGVGDFGVLATANPAVVTNLNGVPISRPQAIGGNFFDLERVEILRGPQGTLYGRNASGGAINLIAARPVPGEMSGYGEVNVGNFGLVSGEGALNIGLSDTAAIRAAAQITDRDGYLSDGSNDDEHVSLRLQALVEPNDRTSLRVGGSYIEFGGVGSGFVSTALLDSDDPFLAVSSPEVSALYLGQADAIFNAVVNAGLCDPVNAPQGCPPSSAILDPTTTNPSFIDTKTWNLDAEFSYEFDFATLTIIPAYRDVKASFTDVVSFSYSAGLNGTPGDSSEQLSLEVRLNGETDNFKWVLGGFFLDEDQETNIQIQSGLIQRIAISNDLGTQNLAVFGEGTFSVTDTLRLIGGLRYTSDERSLTNFSRVAVSPTVIAPPAIPPAMNPPCLPPVALPGQTCDLNPPGANFDSTETFNKVTWKAGVEYDVGPDNLIFGTVSTGFKAGGFNQGVSPIDPTTLLSFEPEEITAYTLGFRNRFLDDRLQVNLELYYWDYTDLQQTNLILDGVGNLTLVTQNAGEAEIKGASLDVIAKLGSNTTLRGAVEYNDAELTNAVQVQSAAFVPPGSTACAVTPNGQIGAAGPLVNVDCSGFPLTRAPKWTGNVGLEHVFDFDSGAELVFDTNLSFTSSRFIDVAYIDAARDGGYALWDASLTYNSADQSWYVGGWIRNITDEAYLSGGGGGASPFVTGFVSNTIGAPRTYGARAGFRF